MSTLFSIVCCFSKAERMGAGGAGEEGGGLVDWYGPAFQWVGPHGQDCPKMLQSSWVTCTWIPQYSVLPSPRQSWPTEVWSHLQTQFREKDSRPYRSLERILCTWKKPWVLLALAQTLCPFPISFTSLAFRVSDIIKQGLGIRPYQRPLLHLWSDDSEASFLPRRALYLIDSVTGSKLLRTALHCSTNQREWRLTVGGSCHSLNSIRIKCLRSEVPLVPLYTLRINVLLMLDSLFLTLQPKSLCSWSHIGRGRAQYQLCLWRCLCVGSKSPFKMTTVNLSCKEIKGTETLQGVRWVAGGREEGRSSPHTLLSVLLAQAPYQLCRCGGDSGNCVLQQPMSCPVGQASQPWGREPRGSRRASDPAVPSQGGATGGPHPELSIKDPKWIRRPFLWTSAANHTSVQFLPPGAALEVRLGKPGPWDPCPLQGRQSGWFDGETHSMWSGVTLLAPQLLTLPEFGSFYVPT